MQGYATYVDKLIIFLDFLLFSRCSVGASGGLKVLTNAYK